MINELTDLFEKHKVSGEVTMKPLDEPSGGECPEGKTPHVISFTTANGTTVTETICV